MTRLQKVTITNRQDARLAQFSTMYPGKVTSTSNEESIGINAIKYLGAHQQILLYSPVIQTRPSLDNLLL